MSFFVSASAFIAGASAMTLIATAGAVISVVGLVVKDPDLAKLGGIMSLVGGVGALASGVAGAAGAVSGEVAAGGIDALAGEGIANAAGYGAESAFMGAEGASLTGGLPEAVTSGLSTAETGTSFQNFGQSNPNLTTTPGGMNAPVTPDPSSAMPSSQFGAAPQAGFSPVNTFGQVAPPTPGAGGVTNWWNSLAPDMKKGIMTMGADALKGVFAGWSKEQEMEFNQKKQNFFEEQERNRSAQPVFKAPVKTGIINSVKAA